MFCVQPIDRNRREFLGEGDLGTGAILQRNKRRYLIGVYTLAATANAEPSGFANLCDSLDWLVSVVKSRSEPQIKQ